MEGITTQIKRLLDPLKYRIFSMIGRAILVAIDNSEQVMKVQIELSQNEGATKVERFQEYGLETYPYVTNKSAEALVLYIGGNRGQGIVVKIQDREYRPTDLEEGDTCLYDYRGNEIRISQGGIIIKGVNGGDLEKMALGEILKTELEKDRDAIQELQTAMNGWVVVAGDGGAALKTALATFFTKVMANYDEILSEVNKNN